MAEFFFTGFPGFLGSALLPRVLDRAPGTTAACLVQPQYAELAHSRVARLAQDHPSTAGRIRIVEGDLTEYDLLLGDSTALQQGVREVFHLAAVYDLTVGSKLAHKVNVDGTRFVLDWAQGCPNLQRVHYVSTCYVSGRHEGLFREEDLDLGQEFNNAYEETKHEAEAEVRRRMRAGMPATIYRPAVVVGDSDTGATQKYDGPYFVTRWLLKQPRIAIMPTIGDPATATLNVVPRDFVASAIAYLSGIEASLGKTYQLADPQPLTIREMLDVLARATGRTLVKVPLPLGLAKGALDYVPGVFRLMEIPSAALDYFVHPTTYATTNTQRDLAGSGIRCPRFQEYAPKMAEFVQRHPEVKSAPMV
ncbi:MAG TPA: SDR family oxidoreductase [Longimicrobiaceae bacterium]|nr:SDR family oxidoreductase [Longimicrobiaceae bacterium]